MQSAGRLVTFTQVGNSLSLDPGQFNDLAVGESATVTFSYNVWDGTATVPQSLTLTVEGRNDGPPTLSMVEGYQIRLSSDTSVASILSTRDLNGDGVNDLVQAWTNATGAVSSTASDPARIQVMLGDGVRFRSGDVTLTNATADSTVYGGTFLVANSPYYSSPGGAVGDLNGDGYLEVASGSQTHWAGEHFAVYAGDAGGVDGTPERVYADGRNYFYYPQQGWGGGRQMAMLDFNGDGREDLYQTLMYTTQNQTSYSGQVVGYLNFGTADGSYFQGNAVGQGLTSALYGWPGEFFISQSGGFDFNGDGYDDLFQQAFHYRGGYDILDANVVFGNAAGTLLQAGAQPSTATQGFLVSDLQPVGMTSSTGKFEILRGGDFNGDGYDDLLLRSYGSPTLSLLWGQAFNTATSYGPDTFAPGSIRGMSIYGLNGLANLADVQLADVNADGYDDVVVVSGGADPAIEIVFGGESSNQPLDVRLPSEASRTMTIKSPTALQGLFLGDLDSDGVADVIALDGNDVHHVVTGASLASEAEIGTATADTLVGSGAEDHLVGGLGDDTLVGGGGSDVLYGGGHNDRLVVTDDGFRKVDGGAGTDTLAFTGTALDLTAMARGRLASVERLDLTGNGAQSLVMSAQDVQGLTEAPGAMTVLGDAADSLRLAGQWTRLGDADGDG
ncbi:MAG: hypothetical protein EPN20_17080, partial [Magnetospirillum sp.]